jgi:hypothetical protein
MVLYIFVLLFYTDVSLLPMRGHAGASPSINLACFVMRFGRTIEGTDESL